MCSNPAKQLGPSDHRPCVLVARAHVRCFSAVCLLPACPCCLFFYGRLRICTKHCVSNGPQIQWRRAAEAAAEKAELAKRSAERRAAQAESEAASARKQLASLKAENAQVRAWGGAPKPCVLWHRQHAVLHYQLWHQQHAVLHLQLWHQQHAVLHLQERCSASADRRQ